MKTNLHGSASSGIGETYRKTRQVGQKMASWLAGPWQRYRGGRTRLANFISLGRKPNGGGWVSWDCRPWEHPWLTADNLKRMKVFSRDFLEREKAVLERMDPTRLRVGFCGNIANGMYVRAVPLRKAEMDVSIFLHPHDTYVMSQPGWEEYDGTANNNNLTLQKLEQAGISLPRVDKVYNYPYVDHWRGEYDRLDQPFLRREDITSFPSYLGHIRTLTALQEMDVLWGTQAPYLAYLANRPYVVSQMGGDLWFEASRDDELGALMRRSFARARLNLVSNPWVYAHARRYGLTNLVYLPKAIDQDVYSPGRGTARAHWEAESGGNFFVLTSSRLDERSKGSSIGIEGFARFVRCRPGARLVIFGWGNDRPAFEKLLERLGILDKVLTLPVSGKARLRDNLRSADIFIDQFVVGYFGSAGMEAMACGVPVVARYELAQYEALCETGAPPVLNAATPEEVERHLDRTYANAALRRSLANQTRKWFVDNHGSERWLPEHQAILAATALSLPADFRQSPLRETLSLREHAYHTYGRWRAPKYPNYGY